MRAVALVLSGWLWLCPTSVLAQEDGADPGGLIDLYEKVAGQAGLEAQRNSEREQRFQASAEERARMLAQVEQDIVRLERQKADLKRRFDANEDRLAALSTALDRRIGDLGELFGVFRQTADDVQTLLFDSLITLEHPERRAEAAALAESTEVPTIPQMRALWGLLMQEIAHSGQVSRFPARIVEPAGGSYEAQAVRVGLFNVVAGGKYLNYLPENNQLVELPRQPARAARRSAEALGAAQPTDLVDFALDPSRGALLGLLVQSPSLIERIQQGRLVGYFILAITAIGLILVAERGLRLAAVNRRIKRQLGDLDQVNGDNPVGRILSAYREHAHLNDLELISRHLETVVIADVAEVRKGLPTIRVLAAVAPLMGLLGTVTGMIGTFQAITLFGAGDPKLMAGGISQALVTTVLGLSAAIPLLLSHSFLSSRATYLSKVIGEQAAGLVAQKAEALARARQSGASSA